MNDAFDIYIYKYYTQIDEKRTERKQKKINTPKLKRLKKKDAKICTKHMKN